MADSGSMTSPISRSATHVAIVSRAAFGGHPRYCAELANALAGEGASVEIIEPAAAFRANPHVAGVSNHAISGPDSGWFRQEMQIAKTLLQRRKSGGTVVFQDTSPIRVALIALLRAATAWTPVTMVHNTTSHLTSARERLKHAAALAALTVPHRVLVHNERQRSELGELALVRSTQIDVVPHGTWSTAPELVLSNGAGERRNLLFFGVMRNNSGLDVLAAAAPTIDSEFADANIRVVGTATTQEISEQLASLQRFSTIDARTAFVSDDEAAELFAWAGFVLIPYTDYSSESGVLMQAISHGVPVITTPGTSVADRVAELDIGPAPTGSFLDQLRAGLTASDADYARWQANLVSARESFRWDEHAQILLHG